MMTPQQRWQTFKRRLPILPRWQWWGLVGGAVLIIVALILLVLPFLLPLGGLEEKPLTELQDPNGAFIELDGKTLYYLSQLNDPTAENVLFLHGFGGSSVDWRETVQSITGYNLYAVDLLGLGLSEKDLSFDLSHPAQADLLVAFMDDLDLQQVHLVGFDMGGNIAVHLAQQYPERVQSLTLVAPSLQYSPTAQIPTLVWEWSFLKRWTRILLRSILPETTEINFRSAAYQDEFITPELVKISQRGYQSEDWDLGILALARDISQSQLTQPLASIETRTLVIWGEKDRWLAPSIADDLVGEIPHAEKIILPEVGHLPMYENPVAFQAALVEFWAKP